MAINPLLESIMINHFQIEIDDTLDFIPSNSVFLPIATNTNWSKFKTILSLPSLILLSQNLSANFRKNWKLLFNSNVHGQSFSTLVKNIVDKGPCLVIVKDTRGFIFGGYTSSNLGIGPNFFG